MRSHKLLAVLGMIVVLAFVGCGDDSTAPTEQIGSDLDPEFLAVQGEIEYFVDSTFEFFVNGMENLTLLAGEDEFIDPVHYGPIDPESDYVSTTYAYGWHVVTILRDRTLYATQLRDSVQFYGDGEVPGVGVVTRDSDNADSLYYKHFWSYSVHDIESTHTNYSGNVDIRLNDLQTSLATISGQHQLAVQTQLVSADSVVHRDFEFDADLADFEVERTGSGWAQGCPVTGTATGTVQMSYHRDNDAPVTSTWSFVLAFTEGSMDATVRRGSTVWTYQAEMCITP